MTAWVILDSKVGHANMARGLMHSIQTQSPLSVTFFKVRNWSIPVGKILQKCWPWGVSIARLAGAPSNKLSTTCSPDIVIGSGGNLLWHTAALAKSYGCVSVFGGSKRSLPVGAVDVLAHYDPEKQSAEGALILPLLPSSIAPDQLRTDWQRFADDQKIPASGNYFACLIGGDGSGYQWTMTDIKKLVVSLKQIADSMKIKWLISTSRRTRPELEAYIRKHLTSHIIQDACWVHLGDKRRIASPYLGGASAVFVGEDSMSMIHESISSGKRVVTFRPDLAEPNRSYLNYLEHAGSNRWILRSTTASLGTIPGSNCWDRMEPFKENVLESVGKMLISQIHAHLKNKAA